MLTTDISFAPDDGKETTIASAIEEFLAEQEALEQAKSYERTQVNVRMRDFEVFILGKIADKMKISNARAAAFLLESAIHEARRNLLPFKTSEDQEAFLTEFANSKGEKLTGDFFFKELTK